MGKYAYTAKFPLRYSDFNFRDELTPASLLCLLQEVAGASADELGFGYQALKEKGLGFIVVGTYCELLRTVRLGETVTVETWPLPPRHVIFERAYRVTDERGEPVALCTSRWCLADMERFTLALPDRLGEAHTNCPYRAEKSVEVKSWKIPRIEGEEKLRLRIGNSVTDHYMHTNNARYAEFFLDAFRMEELPRIKSFLITYEKQVKEGEELSIFRKDEADGATLEARTKEGVTTQMRLWFEEEHQ